MEHQQYCHEMAFEALNLAATVKIQFGLLSTDKGQMGEGRAVGRDWLYLWVAFSNEAVPKAEMEHGTRPPKLTNRSIEVYKPHQLQFGSCCRKVFSPIK